jgi:hypothetical protein
VSRRPTVYRTPAIWLAEADGVAHARSHTRAPRTACGKPALPERYAWTERSRCATCIAVLEEVATADR